MATRMPIEAAPIIKRQTWKFSALRRRTFFRDDFPPKRVPNYRRAPKC